MFAICLLFCKLPAFRLLILQSQRFCGVTLMHLQWVVSIVRFFLSLFLRHRKAIHGPEGPQAPMGQEESELSFDKELEGSLTLTSDQNQQGGLSPLSASGKKCWCRGNPGFHSSNVLDMFQLLKQDVDWNVVQRGVRQRKRSHLTVMKNEISLMPLKCIFWKNVENAL